MSALALAILGLGVASASAHTFSASGECGTANLKWTSFGGSGSRPVNKPTWNITKGSTPAPIASGQAGFSGGSHELEVPIPSTNGRYLASSAWTASNTRDGHSGSGRAEFVLRSCDAITTQASPGVELGGKISDTAFLTGVTDDATGEIEFQLYADADTSCSTPITSSSVAVAGAGEYRSTEYTPIAAGGYQWTASYTGDRNNDALGPHGCGVAEEHVVVTKTPPTPSKNRPEISTVASRSVVVGKAVRDTASLTGGSDDISGKIRFELFRDADTNCERPIFSSEVDVAGNGRYVSGWTRPSKAGGYQWTATYGGDAKNESVGPEGCNEAVEHVKIRKKPKSEVGSVCRVGGGQLSLTGPSGNVRRAFILKIRTRGYSRLTTFVDGRKVDTVRNGSLRKRTISVRVNPRRLAPGVHRIRVVAASGPARCNGVARGLNFVRARPADTSPSFTG